MADKPWLMRTYSGHSSAARSNELYRTNLSRGQTGLSVAFDLPTQIGYDADDPLATGEVGRVGVPISHLGDMEALFEGIPLGKTNTSMTINATAPWLLALYVAAAEKQGVDPKQLSGTTQNDVLKEFLSRGTYALPPGPSLALGTDVIAWAADNIPKWNPINVCSYHLQEAGATPVLELAFTMANAIAYLDAVKARVPAASLGHVVSRISFFCNAGIRFVEELCKMRAFVRMWDELLQERYGITDPEQRRFRYGVQVNSLGLTERQPENNVQRIVIEMLGVSLSRDARARAIQLPCWNEALGLPRPWDQQWSLRMQQVLAMETDLLEYPDLFEGSKVVEEKTAALIASAKQELSLVEKQGGAIRAIETGAMKSRLVEANSRRLAAIERGDQTVVGVNVLQESAESPLTAGGDAGILVIDEKAEREQIERLNAFRAKRNAGAVETSLRALEIAARSGANVMPASIAAAKAGVTTGEWGAVLRRVHGDFRAPTGVSASAAPAGEDATKRLRAAVDVLAKELGGRPKILVGKPGLDGHSNGAELIAVAARDAGFEVVYLGIRLTPAQIVSAAVQESVDVVGLSILSGGHMSLVPAILEGLRKAGASDVPVVVGGIVPEGDRALLAQKGVARVFTPKDFDRTQVLLDVVEIVRLARARVDEVGT